MWSLFSLFAYLFALSLASVYGLEVRHVSTSPKTIPIHLHSSRDTLTSGTSTGSGISPVTMSSDKQSYFAVIKTGDISFRVALDTGSADMWIMSSACTTSTCKAVPRYPLTYQSPTFVTVNNNQTKFSATYSDGTAASGFVAEETVLLSNLTVPNQVFAVITDCNVSMADQVSGLIGLGFPRLSSISASVTNSTPFFVTLAQQGLLDYPVFGLSLTRNASGSLSMGAVDSSVVTNTSDISWSKVTEFAPFTTESNSSSYLEWAIPLTGILVNGTQIKPIPTYPNSTANTSIALIDVGTSGLYGPYQDVTRIFSLIDSSRLVDSSGQWAIPCDTEITLSFTFGNKNFTLQPSDFLIGPTSGNPDLCLAWPKATAPSADGMDWQIGTAFLRTVYSVFSYGINDKESPMIGFYPLSNTTTPSESQADISSFLSAISATVATTLPNSLLSTPSYTTPAYTFNTSVTASIGGIVSAALATSTYSAIFGTSLSHVAAATAIPTVSPSPTLATLILTNDAGFVTTSTSSLTESTVTLGVPPGWSAGFALRAPLPITLLACIISFTLTLVFT